MHPKKLTEKRNCSKSTGKQPRYNFRISTKTVKSAIDKLCSRNLRAKRCLKFTDEQFDSDDDFKIPKRKMVTTCEKVKKQVHFKTRHGSSSKAHQDKIAPSSSSCNPAPSTYDPSDLSCDQWLLLKPKLPYSGQQYVGRSVDEVSKRLQGTCMSIQLEGFHKESNLTSGPPVFLQRNLKLGEKTVHTFLNKKNKILGQQQHDVPELSTPTQAELSQDNNGTTHVKNKCTEKAEQKIPPGDIAIDVLNSVGTMNAVLQEGVLSTISDEPCSLENDINVQPEYSCQIQHVSQFEGQRILKEVSSIGSSSPNPSKHCTNAERDTNLLSRKTLLSRKRENVLPPNTNLLTPTGTHLDSDIKQTLDELPKCSEIAYTGNGRKTPCTTTLQPRKRQNNECLNDENSHGKYLKDDKFEAINVQTSDNAQSAKRYKLCSHNKTNIEPFSTSLTHIKNVCDLQKNSLPLMQSVPVDYIVGNKDNRPILQNNVAIVFTGAQDNCKNKEDTISASRQVKVDSTSLDIQNELFSPEKPVFTEPFRSLFFRAISSKRRMVWSVVDEN